MTKRVSVFVCVCVCVREREREKETGEKNRKPREIDLRHLMNKLTDIVQQ